MLALSTVKRFRVLTGHHNLIAECLRGNVNWCKPFSTSSSLPELVLFTKPGECSLCEEMKEALEPYLSKIMLMEVDITLPENDFWKSRYKYEIPVVHHRGKLLMKHRFDKEKLESILSAE